MKKRLENLQISTPMKKQPKDNDSLSDLHAVSPGKKEVLNEYQVFFKSNYEIQQKKYPTRNQQEISKLVNLLWKVEKQQRSKQKLQGKSDNQKNIYQVDGYVVIDNEKIVVPQPPVPVYNIFQRNMKRIIEETHTNYNGAQINTTIQFAWTTNQEEKEKAQLEYQSLKEIFDQQKQEFINKYGFWPKKQKQGVDTEETIMKKVKQSSEQGNSVAQMMMQKVNKQTY